MDTSDLKYRLTQAQLRDLDVSKRPTLAENGKATLIENKNGKPYRFRDGTPGAPIGFGFYVGPMGAFYEVRIKHNKIAKRISLGSVKELSLATAHELANAQRAHVRQTGEDPRERVKVTSSQQAMKRKTVRQAMLDYVADLEEKRINGKVKSSSIRAVELSLARLEREDVNLADREIATLRDEDVIVGWHALRHSSMKRSNRLSPQIKSLLEKQKEWWKLDLAALVKLGLSAKQAALAKSAGLAATEYTMGDARRAVDIALNQARKLAAQTDRQPALVYNPFTVLGEKEMFRSNLELNRHYEQAKVRNPLGMDDAQTGQKTLPSVLKALMGRRALQGGNNATGVDYLLLTLLWGARRGESSAVRWFDSCTKDELDLNLASWVWLTPEKKGVPIDQAINPITGFRGSQVFFHDTKSGEFQLLPVSYFADKILRWRQTARELELADLPMRIAAAKKTLIDYKRRRVGPYPIARAEKDLAQMEYLLDATRRWVFPARNQSSKTGHHTDSKAMLDNIRLDAGLFNPKRGIDINLTPHDLRRTLSRVAAKLLPGHKVSQLLNHHSDTVEDKDSGRRMAKVTERYSQQEWPELRKIMAVCEDEIIASSPRVWNILRGPDRPAMDEKDDPPLELPTYRPGNVRRTKYA